MERLAKNDKAIEFAGTDYLGNEIKLSDYKGKKVLISFFRGASCPFCNMRIHQMISQYSEFETRGIQLIAFFAATQEEIKEYAGKQTAPFPIIADPTLTIYKKYRIEESHLGMFKALINPVKTLKMMFSGFFNLNALKDRPIVPADFLIDEELRIHTTYYGKDFGDHIPLSDVMKW